MPKTIEDFEAVGRPFDAQFTGYCAVNRDHKVKRGTKVTRVQNAVNPLIPVSGVACSACTKILPRVGRP